MTLPFFGMAVAAAATAGRWGLIDAYKAMSINVKINN